MTDTKIIFLFFYVEKFLSIPKMVSNINTGKLSLNDTQLSLFFSLKTQIENLLELVAIYLLKMKTEIHHFHPHSLSAVFISQAHKSLARYSKYHFQNCSIGCFTMLNMEYSIYRKKYGFYCHLSSFMILIDI